MKRNVLALGAAAVIAGLPVAAVLSGSGDSEAAPSRPGQSATDESADGATTGEQSGAPAEASPSASTVPPPPLPVPVPVPGGDDDSDDDDDDHREDDDDSDDDD